MSLSLNDVRITEQPPRGTIPAGVNVSLGVTQFIPNGVTPEGNKKPYELACDKLINRLYGDIAQDFEKFLKALDIEPTGEALQLCEVVRSKLKGGGGIPMHRAP